MHSIITMWPCGAAGATRGTRLIKAHSIEREIVTRSTDQESIMIMIMILSTASTTVCGGCMPVEFQTRYHCSHVQ